jgi:hypothetical protein
MKSIVFFAIIAVTLLHCDTSSTPADTASTPPPATAAGSFAPPTPPDLSLRETQSLIRNYWVFELVRDTRNPANNRTKPGTWYQFNPDGTFAGGQWSETTMQGSWRFRTENGRAYLNIDSAKDSEDIQFEIQGINADADAMSWVSTDLYGNGGMLLKTINLLTIPTKEQFGVE